MPSVSVIMPVWNAAAAVGAAVASVRVQTLRDWELIVIDDGSTDESVTEVERATAGDPRVRVVPVAHEGIVAALNAGIDPWHERR